MSETRPPRIMVCSVPRSGTQYQYRVLRSLGLKIGHENDERDGCVSYRDLFAGRAKHGVIFHSMRHPLRAISALQAIGTRYAYQCADHLELPREDRLRDPRLVHLLAWVQLNWHFRAVQTHGSFRVEFMEDAWPRITSARGIEYPFPRLNRSTGSRASQYEPLSWSDLRALSGEFTSYAREMATEMRYDPDRPPRPPVASEAAENPSPR